MVVAHRHADLPGHIEPSACDRSTRELLEIVLGPGLVDIDDIDTITRLIDSGQVVVATEKPDALADLVELRPSIVDVLVATLEIARRASLSPARAVIRGPADVAAIARRDVGGRTRECVLVIACDGSNHVLRTTILTRGSADAAPVPVREILNAVLRCDGRAFAVAHNHPTGVLNPTEADVVATERVAAGAHVVGLRFLGHVVVGGDDWTAVATSAQRTLG